MGEAWAGEKTRAGLPSRHSDLEVVQGAKHSSQQRRFFSSSSLRQLGDVAPGWWGLLCLLTNAGIGFTGSYRNIFLKEGIAYGARCQQKEKRPLGIDVCLTKEAKESAVSLVEPAWDAVLASRAPCRPKLPSLAAMKCSSSSCCHSCFCPGWK